MKFFDRKDVSLKHKQFLKKEHLGNGYMDLKGVDDMAQLVNNPIGVPDMDTLKRTRSRPKPVEIVNFNRTFDTDDLGNLKVGTGYKRSIKLDKIVNKTKPQPSIMLVAIGMGVIKKKKTYNNLKFEL